MFGVGLHFSLSDLLSVRRIAIPGAVVQIAIATLLGLGLALAHRLVDRRPASSSAWRCRSPAPSCLLRALQERRLIDSERGRIAVGWLMVEDLAMVLALVLLPALAGLGGDGGCRRCQSATALAHRPRHHARQGRRLRRADAGRRPAASSRGSCTTSPIPARANCSASRCSRSRSASPSAPPSCSASPSRSAPSSPA